MKIYNIKFQQFIALPINDVIAAALNKDNK